LPELVLRALSFPRLAWTVGLENTTGG